MRGEAQREVTREAKVMLVGMEDLEDAQGEVAAALGLGSSQYSCRCKRTRIRPIGPTCGSSDCFPCSTGRPQGTCRPEGSETAGALEATVVPTETAEGSETVAALEATAVPLEYTQDGRIRASRARP